MTSASLLTNPALAAAKWQWAVLGELAETGLVVGRYYAHAPVAASSTAESVLADEHWQPATGRARALAGPRDGRRLLKSRPFPRQTPELEFETAEAVRDPRAGIAAACRKTARTSPKPPVYARISKLADAGSDRAGAGVSREGVQRDRRPDLPGRLPKRVELKALTETTRAAS